jgi:hypothetical protein
MSGSLLARALLVGLALSFLAVPAAFADDPRATSTETTTNTTTTETTGTETTTEPATERATNDGSSTTAAENAIAPPDRWAETSQTLALRARALHYRAVARRWRRLMRKPAPHLRPHPRPFESLLARRQWRARAWRAKARRARYRGHHPPRLDAWLCIHSYEGSWRDPNAPYYGGLQMDLTFQRRYAPGLLRRKGTADHWTRFEQIWVAERAFRAGQGFYPWPLTARRCGLI